MDESTLMARDGIVLFGHGARDARWAAPFERLAERVRATGNAEVSLAFLEMMTPDLQTAIGNLSAAGCDRIKIVPVFFGQGAHLRRDFPVLVEQCRQAYPALHIECAQAAGEDDGVLDALAAYALAARPLP